MSGLSLASHPRLAGAGRHGRRKPGLFARSPRVRLSCVSAFGGFALLCFMPVALCCHGFPRSHCFAHAFWRGRFLCSRWGWQLGLVVGVFARGWFGVCATVVFAWGVCAFLVLALWWGGGAIVASPPLRAHCPLGAWAFGAHALVWACWRVRRSLGCGGNGKWGGTTLSRPIQRGAGLLRSPRGAEEKKGGGGAPRSGEHNPLALAYVGTGTPLSVLNRLGVEPRGACKCWPGWGRAG